jgi:hypothetical protein
MKRRKPQVAGTRKGKPGSPAPPGTTSGGLKIPPILFEGDKPEPAPAASAASTDSLRSSFPTPAAGAGPRELPEAYGTGRLLVLARDPHCLYTHWDLTSEQMKHFQSQAGGGRLVVRGHRDEAARPVAAEMPTEAGARHVFLAVPAAGTRYVVELGYYAAEGRWVPIAAASPAATPDETASEDRTIVFATVPPWPQGRKSEPAAHGPTTPPRIGWIPVLGLGLTIPTRAKAPRSAAHHHSASEEWSETQERALEELMDLNMAGEGAMSSLELTRGWDRAQG